MTLSLLCILDLTFSCPNSIFVTRDDYDDKLVTCSYVAEGVCSVHFIEKAPLYRPLLPYNGFLLSK